MTPETDVALEVNRMIHAEHPDARHDIGLRVFRIIQERLDLIQLQIDAERWQTALKRLNNHRRIGDFTAFVITVPTVTTPDATTPRGLLTAAIDAVRKP